MLPTLSNIPTQVHVYGNAQSRRVYLNSIELKPGYSQKVHNHSPDGFSWGYNGSGPAQLALAILLVYTDIAIATLLYQDFKRTYVATWAMDENIDTTLNMQAIITSLLSEAEASHFV